VATDVERLLVSLDANFTKFERAWERAQGVTDSSAKRMAAKFDGIAANANRAGQNTANAFKPVGLQTANIAAQFQDIAVQLQAGQSPFTIALQQGTQLSAALGNQGLKGTLAALAGGFASVVNPVSLATIAIIGLGGAAVQYLGTLLKDGNSANAVLKEQEDVIRRVAERWGDAVPALRNYVDQLDRAKAIGDLNTATDTAIKQQFVDVATTISDLRATFAGARVDLQQLGASAQEIDQLQAAFDALEKKAKDGKATAADLNHVIALIGNSAGASLPGVADLTAVLQGLSGALAAAARNAELFDQQRRAAMNAGAGRDLKAQYALDSFVSDQERLNSLTSEQLALEAEIARVKADAKDSSANISDQQALDLAKQRLAAEQRRSEIASSSKKADRSADSERQAVVDLIDQLQAEYEQLGMSAQQKEVVNALRRAGAAATDEERAQIVELINATYLQGQAIQMTQQAMQDFADMSKNALSGLITDLVNGKSAADALGNALGNIGNRLLNKGLDMLFGAVFPFADGGVAAYGRPVALPRFAGGGVARSASIFGEAGPEAAVPLPDGRRIPVEIRMPTMGAGSSAQQVHVTVGVSADSSGNLTPFVESVAQKTVAQASPSIVSASVSTANKQTPGVMASYQQQRGGSDYRV